MLADPGGGAGEAEEAAILQLLQLYFAFFERYLCDEQYALARADTHDDDSPSCSVDSTCFRQLAARPSTFEIRLDQLPLFGSCFLASLLRAEVIGPATAARLQLSEDCAESSTLNPVRAPP